MLIVGILIAVFLVLFLAIFALMAVYAERKVSAFIQDRLGPMETGKFGLLQTFADILKMLQKEHILPTAADKILFSTAPLVIFIAVFMAFCAIPFFPGSTTGIGNLGVFYVLAIIAVEVVGLLMAGWGSSNKYALLGSVRSVAQIVSYEIPAGFAVLSAVMIAQSLDMQTISMQQGILTEQAVYFFGSIDVTQVGGFLAWNIFRAPHLLIAFIIYFIASLAQCNRAPFDIPEAESELVAGFHVEYSGIRFGFIFLAEYAMMLLVSLIAVILFLGSWNTPLPNIGTFELANYTTGTAWGIFWIFSKAIVLVLIQMWIRWTLPRFRVDQLMAFCWKVLMPTSIACVLVSGCWKLLMK